MLHAIIVLVNICYAFIYNQRLVVFLVVFALFVYLGQLFVISRAGRARGKTPEPEIPLNFNAAVLLMAPFIIPFLSGAFMTKVMFWNVNPVNSIILSWFLYASIALSLDNRNNAGRDEKMMSRSFILFVLWSSLLWMSVIWDVGASEIYQKAVVANTGDRLGTVIFRIWENRPFSEHLGLGFLSDQDAYSGHSQLYLVFMYLFTKTTAWLLQANISSAARLNCLFTSSLLVVSTMSFLVIKQTKLQFRYASTHIVFFLGLGYLLSLPDLWITLLKYGTDNTSPLAMFITLILFAYISSSDYSSRAFSYLLFLYCILLPFFALITLITLVFFFFIQDGRTESYHQSKKHNRTVLTTGFVLVAASMLYPKLIARLLGYRDAASTLYFRSGLDGDTRYYKDAMQALIDPMNAFPIRPWSSIIPAIIFCTAAYFLAGRKLADKQPGVLQNMIFLLSPFLFSLVFTPQAVSIHPYYYDYLFLFPVAFMAFYWFLSADFHGRLSGPQNYALFLFLSALVLFNLTKIAQASRYL